jgi:hypothetical protein
MNLTLSLAPLVSLLAGAAYLIVAGLLGLFGDIRLR